MSAPTRYTFKTPPLAKVHTGASYPALLKKNGYRTGFIGKFGVGVRKGAKESMFDVFVPLRRSPYFHKQPDGSLKTDYITRREFLRVKKLKEDQEAREEEEKRRNERAIRANAIMRDPYMQQPEVGGMGFPISP